MHPQHAEFLGQSHSTDVMDSMHSGPPEIPCIQSRSQHAEIHRQSHQIIWFIVDKPCYLSAGARISYFPQIPWIPCTPDTSRHTMHPQHAEFLKQSHQITWFINDESHYLMGLSEEFCMLWMHAMSGGVWSAWNPWNLWKVRNARTCHQITWFINDEPYYLIGLPEDFCMLCLEYNFRA